MSSTSSVFPIHVSGPVVHGKGRGGTQLGFPTANIDSSAFQHELKDVEDGVYYGLARVSDLDTEFQRMVMSIGQNITFTDSLCKTAEVHILKKYSDDFYNHTIEVQILGFIRSMQKFDSLDALIKAIQSDIEIANIKLDQMLKK